MTRSMTSSNVILFRLILNQISNIKLGRSRYGKQTDDGEGGGGGGGVDPMMMMMMGQSAAQGVQSGIQSAAESNNRDKAEEREAEARRRASYWNYS